MATLSAQHPTGFCWDS